MMWHIDGASSDETFEDEAVAIAAAWARTPPGEERPAVREAAATAAAAWLTIEADEHWLPGADADTASTGVSKVIIMKAWAYVGDIPPHLLIDREDIARKAHTQRAKLRHEVLREMETHLLKSKRDHGGATTAIRLIGACSIDTDELRAVLQGTAGPYDVLSFEARFYVSTLV